MLRLAGVTIPDDVDVFNGLRMIKGLDTKHSRNRIERLLTKAGLYEKTEDPSGRPTRVYPKIGTLTWKEKSRLIDLLDIPKARVASIRISPRKLRLVADTVRGKPVDEALAILKFLPKSGAPVLLKLLESAIANASNNHDIKADELFVAKITVDEGPTMKRFMARARGRACRIRKRTSSAYIVLREKFKMPKAKVQASPESENKSSSKPASGTKAVKAAKTTTAKTKAPAKTKKTASVKTVKGDKE